MTATRPRRVPVIDMNASYKSADEDWDALLEDSDSARSASTCTGTIVTRPSRTISRASSFTNITSGPRSWSKPRCPATNRSESSTETLLSLLRPDEQKIPAWRPMSAPKLGEVRFTAKERAASSPQLRRAAFKRMSDACDFALLGEAPKDRPVPSPPPPPRPPAVCCVPPAPAVPPQLEGSKRLAAAKTEDFWQFATNMQAGLASEVSRHGGGKTLSLFSPLAPGTRSCVSERPGQLRPCSRSVHQQRPARA
eukprot:TRINITY_DN9058_c0_g1_i1.p1 TRINITY_DN9058_c0_g1~~TRINITY_DN9058_c0_g1_i1.p1  ORF type:complete len:252 (-),score=27.07 TRINITY_DN9058_c0_g1_i1:43-798(-)